MRSPFNENKTRRNRLRGWTRGARTGDEFPGWIRRGGTGERQTIFYIYRLGSARATRGLWFTCGVCLILFIFFIIVRPQLPTVYLNSLSVSNFTVSDNRLAGNWDLGLQFQNPNS
ncbi:hypothetical protein YC2023_093007 [Brassica napus]